MNLSTPAKAFIGIFLSFSITLPVQAQTSKKGFIIKGHIEGITNNTPIYLFDIEEQVRIDSAISKNGHFTLSGKVKRPTTCWLECKDQYAILQVENTLMEFKAPIQNMRLYASAKGGREQSLQNKLAQLQFPYDKTYMSAYDSLEHNQFTTEQDRKRLVDIFNTNQDISQQVYINFGKQHPNSWLGLDILYRNREQITPDTLKLIFDELDSTLKTSQKAISLRTYLYGELADIGKLFIDFTAQTLEGASFRLSSLKGNYILLNFWSAACVPCRKENKRSVRTMIDLIIKFP
ncbi:TlpA disulfide reductase family protein [Paraflavitalea speifideaquila]|uniref:TlpA disulfide reductase family protein n=1 Tax=Paraflavitalea speifideaquila TaxID=3076558 RepID=UPI0028F0B274|nr:TlpA disulfide reductase family protein [Paraflavitalea speifideiaquila]